MAVGKSSALSVTLTNAGNSNVTVSKVSVSGRALFRQRCFGRIDSGARAIRHAGCDVFSPGVRQFARQRDGDQQRLKFAGDHIAFGDGTLAASQAVSHSVTLTWTPSTSAVAGYDVYRSEVSGGPYPKLDSSMVAADSYTDTSVQSGLTYYYVITAVTSSGVQSADSAQTSAIIPTT